ncbi:MAG TPA: DUF2247 family protein [Tepidisphaeraceae bacterium]|jgi:hypothetical protein|nr:DUF2247 family protein [Tepidisphaeraceae bacterium]
MIASSLPDDPCIEPVSRLASAEGESDKSITSDKWLCIVLSWLYENRATLQDPLGIVEELYADFDYPAEIAPLVRYMPSHEPSLGSIKENEERIFSRWHQYITGRRREYLRKAE